MLASEYYKLYIADDSLSELSTKLFDQVMLFQPGAVLDFGCGSGKHSILFQKAGVVPLSLDISMMNVVRAHSKYDLPFVACGNESHLRFFTNVDVVFTVSVLDHIENIDQIINDFKRIANKGIVLAETNDPGELYFPHDYESYGFKKLDYEFHSDGDSRTYNIWVCAA